LSVCLVGHGRSLLNDPGTHEYVGPSSDRARLRSTGAHNTLQIDECDQAEGTGPFSWKNFPQVTVEQWITGQQFNLFQGSHNGYTRLLSPVVHRRWVFHRKGEFWLVRDLAEGKGMHRLQIAWHFGPAESSSEPLSDRQDRLALLTVEGHGWSESTVEDYCSPAYGVRERAKVTRFSTRAELPADFVTLILANASSFADRGRLVRMTESGHGAVRGFGYSNLRQEHNFFFSGSPGSWSLGPWSSDADFLYCSRDLRMEKYMLVLCNGSYADVGGSRVLNCRQRVRYAEVSSFAGEPSILSSDPEQVIVQQPIERVWAKTEFVASGKAPTG